MSKFYSQAGQDEWVVNYFKSKKNGFFLDIGANDGIELSNSYYLETQLDWSGICIEADPKIYESLCHNRKSNCVNVAVSDFTGKINFLPSGLLGKVIESNDGTIELDCDSIDNILKSQNAPKIIDYLSLDVEGMEAKVLSKFPFREYEIILITVEHNLYNGGLKNKEEISRILIENGFSIAFENVQHQGFEFEDWYINNKYIQ